ncbi:hypothetical protein [Tianweitania sediminis]|uniref:Uncharacterized protein n=1 Tax=Tianweitania sediminis TaxID=1502156 RepID=A0A8J7R1J6_9HYPH|nr:hypothetical protein [Tianweitania sediminis]MBP0441068.1 hypothetical protein [Tianweitania sediminis]HEV7416198.1 hypothetical protein [Tianweitania sediminis]
MDLQALLVSQLTDIFRIGMIVFLALTAARTATATQTRAGRAAPLILGVLFIAVLIPVTFYRGAPDLLAQILMGVASNTLILAAVLGILRLWRRMQRR